MLVFGQRRDGTLTALPRAGVAWSFPRWVVLGDADSRSRARRPPGRRSARRRSAERPPNVVALADVPPDLGGRARLAGRAAGALATGSTTSCSGRRAGRARALPLARGGAVRRARGGGVLELWPRGGREPAEQPLRAATWSRARRDRRRARAPARRGGHHLPRLRHARARATCASTRSRDASRCAASGSR